MPLPAGVASRPALAFTISALAEIMTACFEGYVVPQTVNGEMFNARFRRESLDLRASRVLMEGERPVALILVARRGWTARIAAMGIVPSHRARGLGRSALGEVIDDLRGLGDRRLVLEVIDSNEPAIRLYSSLGFRTRRRLIGYRRPAGPEASPPMADLVEVDPLIVARRVAEEGPPDLPWIMAPETLAAGAAPARGLSLAGEAFAIVEPVPQPSGLALRTLVVSRNARGRGLGEAMIRALAAAHPGQDLLISANFPEDLVPGFMVRMGFDRTPIGQFEMELDLPV
ncbi:GNAT family N-acetyltransferase [Microvirga arsenatis]|uniref:GNAT family N-acetyltransferase n=1 Tax=Microvirga arsenatis TaxID=2692265 RepID=A0ABW9YUN9_9HYPH|nr:GNAT family N-acetyltransferase [Microvirga arsenatis]NBJ09322.1 GNAT family N-acetyltransferase [Microvirga arsenatis]NBJ23820.1 GNAT family N-acetyltransferase [Microvirga arsenatis]